MAAASGSLAVHATLLVALAIGAGALPTAPAPRAFRVYLELPAIPPLLDPVLVRLEPELFPAFARPVVWPIEYPEVSIVAPPPAISPDSGRAASGGEVEVTVAFADGAAGVGASAAETTSAYWSGVRAKIAAALEYPPDALTRRAEGVVWVTIEVDAHGVPVHVEIADGAPDSLAAAVRRTLDRATAFEPPPDGAARRARLPIRFAVAGSKSSSSFLPWAKERRVEPAGHD